MNTLDRQYLFLLRDILNNGVYKSSRNGNIISVFGRQIRHKMSEGFPILTTKKIHWKSIVTELLWFLRGDTNVKYLIENNCNIWNGDIYKHYLKNHLFLTKEEFIEKIKIDSDFARKHGDLGPIYGYQWRKNNDQISKLIHLLKTDPNSRRLLVSSWDVDKLDQMVLPPCHYSFQLFVQDRYLSLMWNQRSVDTFLGLPFNISSYALLLNIIAKEVNMIPYELIGNLGDTHIYENHIEAVNTQLKNKGWDILPKLEFEYKIIENYSPEDFNLINYKSNPQIFAPLNN